MDRTDLAAGVLVAGVDADAPFDAAGRSLVDKLRAGDLGPAFGGEGPEAYRRLAGVFGLTEAAPLQPPPSEAERREAEAFLEALLDEAQGGAYGEELRREAAETRRQLRARMAEERARARGWPRWARWRRAAEPARPAFGEVRAFLAADLTGAVVGVEVARLGTRGAPFLGELGVLDAEAALAAARRDLAPLGLAAEPALHLVWVAGEGP